MIINNSKLTIIMYHYVRDLKNSRYPTIKGLDIHDFNSQILYLKKHYNFISIEMLIDAIKNQTSLPKNSVLLTFDDAYMDHFQYVFPLLDKYKIQGCFYPPAKAISEHKVLDVNKIHFILAVEQDIKKLIKEIKIELSKHKNHYNLKDYSYYYKKLGVKSRFDTADVIFIKRLLQVELPEEVRKTIVNSLFNKIVRIDEESFSRELYMDMSQLQCMNRNGMHIGSHCYNHYWLSSLSKEEQEIEIKKSLEFLKKIQIDLDQWTICYPYGDYNNTTLEVLKKLKCKLAFTTKVAIADIQNDNQYTLPRLDTNDIPMN